MVLATKCPRAHLDIHFIIFFFFVHISFRPNSALDRFWFFPGMESLNVLYIQAIPTTFCPSFSSFQLPKLTTVPPTPISFV